MTMLEEKTAPDFVKWLERQRVELAPRTDGELAEKLGIRPDVQSRIFTGKGGPSAQVIDSIMSAREISEGSAEYYELLRAAHVTNLEIEKRRHRPGRKPAD